MKMKQRWIIFSALILSIFTTCSRADFEVMQEEYADTKYGNAQTGSFHRAITGGSELTPQEQAEFAKVVPERDWGRYYGRVRLNFSTLALDELRNKSTGSEANGIINKKRGIANQAGLEIAIGYAWEKSFRGDIEYLVNRNLNYTANPVLTGSGITSRQLTAQVKNNTLLANLYYDFAGLNRLRPYLTAGVGVSANSVQATLSPAPAAGGSNTVRSLRVAWALGAGFRLGIFRHWYLDTSYRYIRLGSGVRVQPNSSVKLLGNYSMSALSLGLIYLF